MCNNERAIVAAHIMSLLTTAPIGMRRAPFCIGYIALLCTARANRKLFKLGSSDIK